jgi:hypothetical protein
LSPCACSKGAAFPWPARPHPSAPQPQAETNAPSGLRTVRQGRLLTGLPLVPKVSVPPATLHRTAGRAAGAPCKGGSHTRVYPNDNLGS